MGKYRETVLNALDGFSRDNTSLLFAKAVRLLGFPGPASKRHDSDAIVESADMISIQMGKLPLSLDLRELYQNIRSAICECKDNEKELEFFICDVITKFSNLSAYVFPKVKGKCWDEQIAALTLFKTTDHYNPADSIINEWRKYEQYCVPTISNADLEAAVNHRLKLFHNYFKDPVHGPIHSIIASMKAVASLIDAALLENDCEQDFFYFQRKAHCVITYELDSYDLSDNSGVNRDRIDEKLFDRTYYHDLAPNGLLLPELMDQINDYRNNGTWNFTRRSYLSIIAAPEDIRQANLSQYLSEYRNYVYLLNEDGILREMLAVFYDLYKIWEECRHWYHKTTFFPYPCPEIVNLFRQQTVHYIALAYFIYMINPKTCRFDIYTLYPGIKREEVKEFICNQYRFLSEKDFDRHEKEIEAIPNLYEPFHGYYSSKEKEALAPAPVEKQATVSFDIPNPFASIAKQFQEFQSSTNLGEQFKSIADQAKEVQENMIEHMRKVVEEHDRALMPELEPEAPENEDELVEEEEDNELEVEGKVTGAESYRRATMLCSRLCGLGLIKYRSKTTYKWLGKGLSDTKSRLAIGYLCFMFWKYFLHGMGQIDQIVFCDLIRSDYNQETIGTYARDFRLQDDIASKRKNPDNKKHKVVPADIKEKIDKLFKEFDNSGYFRNPR